VNVLNGYADILVVTADVLDGTADIPGATADVLSSCIVSAHLQKSSWTVQH
jgi:hypothetical protein